MQYAWNVVNFQVRRWIYIKLDHHRSSALIVISIYYVVVYTIHYMYYTLYYTEKSMCIKLHTANILNIFVSFTTSISFLIHRSQLESHDILCFMRFLYSHSVVFRFMCLHFTKILIEDKKYAVLVLNFRYFIFSKTFFSYSHFVSLPDWNWNRRGVLFIVRAFDSVFDIFSMFFLHFFFSAFHQLLASIEFQLLFLFILCAICMTHVSLLQQIHTEIEEKKSICHSEC